MQKKWDAQNRGLAFELTEEKHIELISALCFYCNTEPKELEHYIRYNGVDRINNAKGYLADNVVPCCTVCNVGRSDDTQVAFIGHAAHVHIKHVPNARPVALSFKDTIPLAVMSYGKANKKPIGQRFSEYKYTAKRMQRRFELKHDEFDILVRRPCFYCGFQCRFNGIGVDRVDNDEGYIASNVNPCCWLCNRMKGKQTLRAFCQQCQRIAKKWKLVTYPKPVKTNVP